MITRSPICLIVDFGDVLVHLNNTFLAKIAEIISYCLGWRITIWQVRQTWIDEWQNIRNKRTSQEILIRDTKSERIFWEELSYSFLMNFNLLPADDLVDWLASNWSMPSSYARISGTLETLASFKRAHVKIILLSNAFPSTWNILRYHFKSLDLFDGIVFSYECGYAKPDREIYELALQKAGVKPGQALFVDDHLPYVQAAMDYGIPSVLAAYDNKRICKLNHDRDFGQHNVISNFCELKGFLTLYPRDEIVWDQTEAILCPAG